MKVGLFGGAFDPIHRGHVAAAGAALRALELDRVELMVTGRPPHKGEALATPALARYAMVELALLDHDRLVASSVELDEERPSYTIDTLERRRRDEPEAQIWFLLGADALAGLATWRRFEAILESFPLAVLHRPGHERERAFARLEPAFARRLAAARIEWIENPPVEASSTRIRERLGRGERPPEGWLDPRVLRFIEKYRLYR